MAVAGIFVSYRRQDSAGHAGRIVDTLERRFGKRRVFMDVEAVKAGTDFVEAIDTALDRCFAFVAVIGPEWLEVRDTDGRRRLDDPDDFIRRELSHALQHGVRVVPVLVQGATMPTADRLPEELRRIARIQALKVSDERWEYDTGRLIEALEERKSYGRALKIAVPVALLAIAGAVAYWQLARPLEGPAGTPPQPIEAGQPATTVGDPTSGGGALPPADEVPPSAADTSQTSGSQPAPGPSGQDPAGGGAAPPPSASQQEPPTTPAAKPEPGAPVASQSVEIKPEPGPPIPSPQVPATEPPPEPLPDRRAGWCLPGDRRAAESRCAPGYYARLAIGPGWMLTPESVIVVEPVPGNLPREDVLGWCAVRQLESGEPLAGADIGGCRPGSYARRRTGSGWMLLPKSVIAMEPLPRDLPLEDLVGWCLNRVIEPGERLVPGIVSGCRMRLYAGRRVLAGERVARQDLIRGAGRLTDAVFEELVGRCAGRTVDSGQPFGPGDLRPCR